MSTTACFTANSENIYEDAIKRINAEQKTFMSILFISNIPNNS